MSKDFGLKNVEKITDSVELKEVTINGNLCGEFVELSTMQEYENKGNYDVEGEYIFPLPDTAVLTGIEINLGGRSLRAKVEEKSIASKIIEDASLTGKVTLSLEEIEENVFKITLGKIMTNEIVKIKVDYIDELIYEDDSLKLIVPPVLSPKNVFGKKGRDNILDKEYICTLNLLVEPLTPIEIESQSHDVEVEWGEDNLGRVFFKDENQSLDEELVLTFKEKIKEEAHGMIYQYKDEEKTKGILYLRCIPDLDEEGIEEAKNYDFLIDISQSMEGYKIQEAKDALELCLRNLSEGDSFNIIAAENELHYFSKNGKVVFDEDSLRAASDWIESLTALDDAEMLDAIKYCLNEHNKSGYSTILVFTDDEGNKDEEIIGYVRKNIGDNRIFTFGIDSSASSYLINKLAEVGYGKAEFIYPGERIDDMVLRQFGRIENPQVDVTKIDWGNMEVVSTYPRTIDYFYDLEPFSIFAIVNGEIEGKITIHGLVGDKEYKKEINLDNLNLEENAKLINKVWMRKRIESLEEKLNAEKGDIKKSMKKKVIELSKDAGILSSYTSFIMVESFEEPVLGFVINNIVPLNVSEETIKNINEAYFIESPNFIYKSLRRERPSLNKVLGWNENQKYTRTNMLRVIARNQLADGAFSDSSETRVAYKLKSTAVAVLSFTLGKEGINNYINQINKSIKFMLRGLENNIDEIDENLYKLIILSFKSSLNKGIVKGNIKLILETKVKEVMFNENQVSEEALSLIKLSTQDLVMLSYLNII
ncbi:MAG: VIT and VWA domain-containing protein [Clostridiaceae bacterium]